MRIHPFIARNRCCFGLFFIVFMACSPAPSEKKVNPSSQVKDSTANAGRPLLTNSYYEAIKDPELKASSIDTLRLKIEAMCRTYLDNDSISGIAVEFFDLRSGSGFTIFPNKRFIPASLLKIPILIAAFKLEEEKPGSLATMLPVYDITNDDIDINLEENETYDYRGASQYTLNDLIKIMISHSDNRATLSVLHFLDKQSPGIIERVERDMNASIPIGVDNKAEIVHIGHFATMFKALYSCNYLNEKHSGAALEILSKSKYKRGFRKSIPDEVRIAHKFGVRFNVSELNPEFPVQLHEVGLIYHPSNPFILSVMTKGVDIEPLRRALREIAHVCYSDISLLSKNEEN